MFLASVHVAHVCVDDARVLFGITHRHFHTHSPHVGLMLVALTSDMMVTHTHMQDLLITRHVGLSRRQRDTWHMNLLILQNGEQTRAHVDRMTPC